MYLSIAHVLMNHGVIYPLSIRLFDQYTIKHAIYYNIKDMIIQSIRINSQPMQHRVVKLLPSK